MSDVLARLCDALGDEVSTDPEVLAGHRRDTWMLGELDDLEQGDALPRPLAVVRPVATAGVSRAQEIARATATAVVPYGGGSGVCGGVRATGSEIVLSTRRLDGLRDLSNRELRASFGAGTLGLVAEERVAKEGLTIGHWPQSIALATLGGLVATRSAGQYSTAYGNIEDLLLELEVVLPDGQVLRTARTPRASAGPDLRQLFCGSEGILGVVTEVGLSLREQPAESRGQCIHFEDFETGLEAIRELLRGGWQPPVVRLYDARESARQFSAHAPDGRAVLLLLHEGPAAQVGVACEAASVLCAARGGVETSPEAVAEWHERRNHVPGFRGFLEKGIVVDTVEVAATWDRVPAVYAAVVASLEAVPGILVASAHSSHSYRSGTNLYFTFAARPEERARMAETYRECWRRVMHATLAEGGGIAHHHGIGRVRRGFLGDELGPAGLAVLRAVKRALDPDGLLNPGVLLPD